MTDFPRRPVLLTKDHMITGFDSGKAPLNDFLIKYALQNQAGGGARTYVMCRESRVIGYYSLAPASIAPEDALDRVVKGKAATWYLLSLWRASPLTRLNKERG